MRRDARVLFGSIVLTLPACGAEPPPPPAAPPIEIAPPLPPLPPAPPPLLAVPRAEASPRRVTPPKAPDVPRLRSEGKRHALERTAEGIVVISEERGVIGFVKSAAEIRWAGFVDGDAILVASGVELLRAGTPDDAIAGRFEAIAKIDPAATKMASGGKVVVAAAPEDGGAFAVSRDGGKRFVAEKRPAAGPISDVAVRSDGVVVVAIERAKITGDYGQKGVRAEIHVARGPGAWAKGPIAEGFYGSVLGHSGDTISISVPKKGDGERRYEHLGLDAKSRWIAADLGYGRWLEFAWTGAHVSIDIPIERPGFPKPPKGDGMDAMGGLMGGLGSMEACRGAACLARRSPVSSVPIASAFHDGVCAKDHVVERKETYHVYRGPGLQDGRDETHTVRECAPDAPAARAPTLHLRGSSPSVVKLPVWCASGRVVATDRAAFVQCASRHRGKPAVVHVAPSGAITEVVTSIAADLDIFGAESTSDGTTVLFGDKATWVCRVDAPACVSVPRESFLAARPVPGGRALVARRGASDHEMVIELIGEPGAVPFRLAVQDNVLEIELTSDGYVRLWTSPTLRHFDPQKSERLLVRSDGVLIQDRMPE